MPTPPMHLVTAPVDLLAMRAVERLLDELRTKEGSRLEVESVDAADLAEGRMPDLRTPSLFGGARALVVRNAHRLPKAVARALRAELGGSPPDTHVILVASSVKPIQALAKAIAQTGGRIDVAPPREYEVHAWQQLVSDELARHGRTADKAARAALLAHAGLDVDLIAEKVAQVCAGVPPDREITATAVEELVVGHGSRGSFAVADAMCARDPAKALALLRGCYEAGDHPIMVLGALAYRVRSLIAVATGVEPRSVGLNVSSRQTAHLRSLREGFGPGELTQALSHLAAADLEIKNGDLSPEFAVERAVLGVATSGLPVPDPQRAILR